MNVWTCFTFLWCSNTLMRKTSALHNSSRLNYVIDSMYDKYDSPKINGSAVNVYIYIDIVDIDNINEGEMEFKIQMFLQEIWMDPRVHLEYYTERSKREKTNIRLPTEITEELWKPDIVFDNTKSGELFRLSVPNTGIKVMPDGEFMRNSRFNLRVTCQMDLHLYPMDTQFCFMMLSLFGHPDKKAKLHWISDEISPYRSSYPNCITYTHDIRPLKFTILPPSSYSKTLKWSNGDFTNLYANFTFIRRLSGSIVIVYIPSTLVVFLSFTSFWLDVNAAPARITLGVTSLLTLATQVVQCRSQLPPVNYMTALDVWLFVCILTVFFTIVTFAISYQASLGKKEDKSSKIHSIMPKMRQEDVIRHRKEFGLHRKNLAGDTMPDLLRRQKRVKWCNNQDGAATNLHSQKSATDSNNHKKRALRKICSNNFAIDSFSRKLFPCLFILFVVIYWIFYISISKHHAAV